MTGVQTCCSSDLKNASKQANLYPQKNENLFTSNTDHEGLLHGWKKHLAVDVLFHSSDFFLEKTAILKQLIIPTVVETPIRPSFLAHIGLELLLDHLLVEHRLINVNGFYTSLSEVKRESLKEFLILCKFNDTAIFFKFLESFISSKYLLSYQKIENISYALNRICMRLWPISLTDLQLHELTKQLLIFKQILEKDFIKIFEEIEEKLRML